MNSVLTFGLVEAYETATHNVFYTKFGHFCLMILIYVILTIPILFVFM